MNILSDGQSIATFAATITAIYVAIRGLHTWREEAVGRRQVELYEELMCLFYDAEEMFNQIRSPIRLAYEIESAKEPMEGLEERPEDAERQKHNAILFVQLQRYDDQIEFWQKFVSRRSKVRALLEEDCVVAFDQMINARRDFFIAAKTRYDTMYQRAGLECEEVEDADQLKTLHWKLEPKEFNETWEARSTLDEMDEFSKNIRLAVRAIEDICLPVIRRKRPSKF